MTHRPLMSDRTLFRDPDLFDADRLPEVFNHRDPELEALAFALRPALRGSSPLNTVVRGPPGTGKTTAVRLLFAEILDLTARVVPVLVPCHAERTVYAVLARVFAALFGHRPPEHGASIPRLLAEVGRALAERGAVLVVCLDDAGSLAPKGVLNDVLIRVLRLHESFPGARTGVLLVESSPLSLHRVLAPATLSTFQTGTVLFPPYTAVEVRAILGDRLRAGVYPGVVPSSVLDLVVESTTASGDLRVGLRLLKEAVLRAELEGRGVVEAGDVEAAVLVAGCERQAALVRTLGDAERTVLSVIAGMAGRGEETTSGLVYGAVTAVEPMGYTIFYERVKRLETLGLVATRQRKKGQGRTREIVVMDGVVEAVARLPAGVAEGGGRRYGGG